MNITDFNNIINLRQFVKLLECLKGFLPWFENKQGEMLY